MTDENVPIVAPEAGPRRMQVTKNVAARVGTNLQRLRQERRLSLSEAARLSGIAKATLSNLEAGRGNPTIDTLAALADVLGVLPGDLLVDQSPKLIRATEGPFLKGTATIGRLLTQLNSSTVDIYEVVFKRGKPHVSAQKSTEAIEQIYVVAGSLKVEVNDSVVELAEGDLFQYPLAEGARITAQGADAKTVLVMSYTQRGQRGLGRFSGG